MDFLGTEQDIIYGVLIENEETRFQQNDGRVHWVVTDLLISFGVSLTDYQITYINNHLLAFIVNDYTIYLETHYAPIEKWVYYKIARLIELIYIKNQIN